METDNKKLWGAVATNTGSGDVAFELWEFIQPDGGPSGFGLAITINAGNTIQNTKITLDSIDSLVELLSGKYKDLENTKEIEQYMIAKGAR